MSGDTLILNQDYQAIGVCNVHRAFILSYLDKVEVLAIHDVKKLHSVSQQFDYPMVIRLKKYVSVPYKKVALTRNNIFKRDGNQCNYCGDRKTLTIDHILPKSRGGKDSWKNLTAACHECNTKKGNKTPEEANMALLNKPYAPSHAVYLTLLSGKRNKYWSPYIN